MPKSHRGSKSLKSNDLIELFLANKGKQMLHRKGGYLSTNGKILTSRNEPVAKWEDGYLYVNRNPSTYGRLTLVYRIFISHNKPWVARPADRWAKLVDIEKVSVGFSYQYEKKVEDLLLKCFSNLFIKFSYVTVKGPHCTARSKSLVEYWDNDELLLTKARTLIKRQLSIKETLRQQQLITKSSVYKTLEKARCSLECKNVSVEYRSPLNVICTIDGRTLDTRWRKGVNKKTVEEAMYVVRKFPEEMGILLALQGGT